MANHLTIGIYNNKQWKHNVVAEEDLDYHVAYNKTWRPGRIFYVDGKRVCNGMIKEEYLPEYDALEKKIRTELLKDVDMSRITVPYV